MCSLMGFSFESPSLVAPHVSISTMHSLFKVSLLTKYPWLDVTDSTLHFVPPGSDVERVLDQDIVEI